jgi:predicted enzyme related to lactoylglutathione lyase
VKQIGARVVTTGDAPMRVGRAGRAVIVEDPDGHFVELAQLDPLPDTSAPASANVIGVRVRLTVTDVGQAMQLYRDGLGLEQRTLDDFKDDPSVSAMLGLSGAQYRIGMAQVPASGLIVEFLELRGVDRRTVRSNLQDPGSTRLQLQVRDIDAAIDTLTQAGGTVVSLGGEPVNLPGRPGGPLLRVAIVRDPNNLFLVLIQAPPAPAG